MGSALVEHRLALLVVCVASLLAGIPLAINMFWHLQVRRVRTDIQARERLSCSLKSRSDWIELKQQCSVWERAFGICDTVSVQPDLSL